MTNDTAETSTGSARRLLDGRWVTDGGLETDLIFNRGADLVEFAAFPLLDDPAGAQLLRDYYAGYVAIARDAGAGILLETPTWRASAGWGGELGYDAEALDRVNRAAVELVRGVIADADIAGLVSGCVGPASDSDEGAGTDAAAAAAYHEPQLRSLAAAGADLVHAMTLNEPAEAVGIVRAARAVGIPVAISFTVETDGRLLNGSSLGDAIAAVDTENPADLYGINCAYPTHLLAALDGGAWQRRLSIFRPNASTRSHAELDELDELDAGDLPLLVRTTRDVLDRLPSVTVLGGCCGTDARHVAAFWQRA